MPEYLAPGVYVEEIPSSNKPIQGASTSTAGMVGMTARGPVGTPTLVSSWGAFTKTFGGYLNPLVFTGGKDALPYAVEGFFNNQGARVFVVRVVGDGATESELMLHATTDGGYSSTLAAAATAGNPTFSVTAAGAAAGTDLLVIDGENSEAVSVQGVAGTDVTATAPLAANHPAGAQVVEVTPVLAVHARDVGSWGDSLRVTAAPSAMLRTELAEGAAVGDLTVTLKTAFGLYPGSVVLVDGAEVREVAAVDTGTGVLPTPLLSASSTPSTLSASRVAAPLRASSSTGSRWCQPTRDTPPPWSEAGIPPRTCRRPPVARR
jgi:phage tail sheath protein FI